MFDVQKRIFGKYLALAPRDYDRFLCAFSHIFAGGYSCGYYSYKWAEVLSADAFGAFEEAGLENEAAVRELGQRFRDTVLACGGGTPPAEVFEHVPRAQAVARRADPPQRPRRRARIVNIVLLRRGSTTTPPWQIETDRARAAFL